MSAVPVACLVLTCLFGCGPGGLAGCQPLAPATLPSGAQPGQPVEGVDAGAKSFVWGAGADKVELLDGLSLRASGDPTLATVAVRGHPATVYQIAESQNIALSWDEDGCSYTVFLDDAVPWQALAEYASRY